MMKKVRFLAAMLCIPLFGGTLTYANEVCDQTFYGKLRYGNGYIFDDSFNGTKSQSYYMWNYKVNSSEQYDYNNSPDFPSFGWTQEIKDQKYEVKPGQSIKIIQAKTPYYINAVPQKRDQKNLTVKYTITYSTDEAGKNKTSHVECKYYEITWCGDGVLDEDRGEQCDPKDPSKKGWGNGGCDASCKPITTVVEQPKCNSQYNGQTLENLVEGPHLCSIGTYANFNFNAATNTWTWTCNGVAGTTSAQCSAKKKPAPTPDPKCSSEYNGKLFYNKQHPTAWLNAGMKLCNPGEVVSFVGPNTKGIYTWGCKLGNQNTASNECQARELWCGDGVVQPEHGEECDPNATQTNPDKICNNTCKLQDKPVYDLALTKKLATSKKEYELGDLVDFTITVYNQGNLPAKNIQVTEYIPEGLILEDAQWTKDGNKATRMITETILPGASKVLSLTMRISDTFKGTKILNKAEISKDNAADHGTVDKDSTPDQNSENDCIVGEDNHYINGDGKKGGDCTPATDEDDHDVVPVIVKPEDPKVPPHIEKDLLGDKEYKYQVGELVGFKMPFGNTGSKTITNVKIRDILPLNLEYVSSEIHGVTSYTSGLIVDGGKKILEYSGFNLAPGQKGYLLMTGRVLSTNLDNRVNWVGIYENNYLWDWDDEPYQPGKRALRIDKSVDKKLVASGDIVSYTIKVNVLEGGYDKLLVSDILPKDVIYQQNTYVLTGNTVPATIENFTTEKNASGLDLLKWNLSFPKKIQAGQSFQIVFKAKFVGVSTGKYTNTACVEDPTMPADKPVCDDEDISPKADLKIKKYVNKKLSADGREDLLMAGFAKGQTGFFTLEVGNASSAISQFTITDIVDGNLQYLDSTNLLNNAFTGVYLRAAGNATGYAYTTEVKAESLSANQTKLTWKVTMTQGEFLPGDKYVVQFMAKVNGDHRNVATVEYPGGKDDDDAKVQTEEVKLLIKKYVSSALAGSYDDSSATIANNNTAYFKLVVSGATNSLTGFRVEDTLDNAKLQYLTDSEKLASNAFTGVITFGANNPSKPAYTITPVVVTGASETKITWTVKMAEGAYFMPGDSLEIIFMTKKLQNTDNTAYVYYPKRDGTEGSDKDPASVTYTSGGGGTPPSSGGGGGRSGGGGPTCGDGRQNGIELCDWGSENGKKIIKKGEPLFKSHDNPKSDYEGEYVCTNKCTLERKGDAALPACFNVQNGSISIMKGEMLPFYWNIEGLLGKRSEKEKTDYLQNSFFLSKTDNTCESKDNGKIDLRTMMCEFRVYGPGQSSKTKSTYTFTVPCLGVDGWRQGDKVARSIESFILQNQKGRFGGSELVNDGQVKNVFDSLDNWKEYPTLVPVSSKLILTNFGNGRGVLKGVDKNVVDTTISNFGEYKLSLEKIDYQTCTSSTDTKGNTVYKLSGKNDGYDRVCEVDFAVTDHYLVQKSPYGEVSSSTPLKKYQTKRGESLFDTLKNVNPSNYAIPSSLDKTYKNFVAKYSKLAKKVKDNIRKVPGKSIYFVDGKSEINLANMGINTTKPFTLIAKEGANIVIRGSLYTNAMIMTQGSIIFDAEGACNGDPSKYGHAGQMVKGIFYAGGGFASKNDKKNDDLSNSEWCNYGNLHIKGVAIGDLSDVVKARRSELYTWFKGTGGGKSAAEKRDLVINGASVLVEYNPSLRGQLPPGAEEFNKALEVYRK